MASGAPTPGQYAELARHLMAAKMYSLASCVMIFYDIAITFGDEVDKVWSQRFSGATFLWFMNRYLPSLGYVVIIASFHQPWPDSVCDRYILYPEVLKLFISFAIGAIFVLRLYCIYSRSRLILASFTLLLCGELAVKIWAFTDGVRLQLPPGLVGCILTGKSDLGERMMYTWISELVFDTCVFVATLVRPLGIYRHMQGGHTSRILRVIIRDGIMYYAAIFVANLLNVLMFVFAPPDLKVINASFSTLITSIMVSRLMLNLRQQIVEPDQLTWMTSRSRYPNIMTSLHDIDGQEPKGVEATIIGNLGAPIESFWEDSEYSQSEPTEVGENVELKDVSSLHRMSS